MLSEILFYFGYLPSGHPVFMQWCNSYHLAGSEVLIVLIWRVLTFWNVMPCGPVEIHMCSGGIYCLQIQSWRWRQYIPPECWWTSIRLHYITLSSVIRSFCIICYMPSKWAQGSVVPPYKIRYFKFYVFIATTYTSQNLSTVMPLWL
jgi:hypothetical protein